MKKTTQTLDLNNYEKTGNLAVDMVCYGIIHERRRGLWVKVVRLQKAYWDMFCSWVAKEYGEETLDKEFFIDTVKIEVQLMATGNILSFEYEVLTPKAKA